MILTCTACGGLYATENLESFAGTPCRCGTHSFEDKFDDLTSHITKLESSLAELQRVVQEKDRILKEGYESIIWGWDGDCGIGNTIDNVLELTPKDLPKFIPEEEYLRVKQELVDLSRSHTVTALGKCIEKFELLKTHAEAMAKIFENSYYQGSPTIPTYEEYRKDFPK